MNRSVCSLTLLAALTLSAPLSAQQAPLSGDAAYAIYFGDGMRHHVEGRHALAIEHLARAFAMRPQPQTLRMLIRSYDAIGHCDAAEGQRALMRELFASAGAPPAPARCAQTAKLKLECGSADADLLIDGDIATTCDATLTLPAGPHTVEGDGFALKERVELKAGESRALSLPIDAAREARPRDVSAEAEQRVPRLATSSERFRVYLSPDGLYQIWVRLDERAPDLLSPYGPEIRFTCRRGPNGQKQCEQSNVAKK